MLRGEILEPGFCMKIWERKNYFCKSSVKLQPNFLVVYYYLLDWLQMRRIRGGLKVFWTFFSDLVLKPGSSGKFWGESLWTSQQWTSQKTSQHTAQWSKILQSHLNAFISWQQKSSVKNIDGTAWDTDESIKDTQERKSHKKPQSAAKLSHLRIMVHTNFCNKAHQWGEGVDEFLHLVPDIVWHLGLDGEGIPGLVGDSPHGEHRKVIFYSCWLLLVGKAILPVSVLCIV